MIYRTIFLFLMISALLGAEQELVVRLETDHRLTPLHFLAVDASRSPFPKAYVRELERLFRFDLNHNGATEAVDQPVFYQVASEVSGNHLNVRLSSNDGKEEMAVNDLPLTGALNEDRRVIHQAADAVHRALFGANGIASTRLLYTVRAVKGDTNCSEVWQADYDGANAERLTDNRSGYCVTPQYVPPLPGKRADRFVYASYKSGMSKACIASFCNKEGKAMLNLSGNQLMPTISRQRDQVAFISDAAGSPDLFIQPFSPEKGMIGKPRHLYTAPYATQGTPTFSPDGFRIAFVSNKGGSPRVYLMQIPPAGTPLKEVRPVLISKANRENTAPCWSPDGTKIAYCAKTKGVRQIWVYDLITGAERQLTEGALNKENPSWAPNSLHLVYNTSDAGNCQLYVINLKQAKAVRITSGWEEKRFPSWEPCSDF